MFLIIIIFLLFYIIFFSYILYREIHIDRLFIPKINICDNPINNFLYKNDINVNNKYCTTDCKEIYINKIITYNKCKYIFTKLKNPKILLLVNQEININDYNLLHKYYQFEIIYDNFSLNDNEIINKKYELNQKKINDEDYFIVIFDHNLVIDIIITYYDNCRCIYNKDLKIIGVKKKYYDRIFKNFRKYYPYRFQYKRKIYKLDKYFLFEN